MITKLIQSERLTKSQLVSALTIACPQNYDAAIEAIFNAYSLDIVKALLNSCIHPLQDNIQKANDRIRKAKRDIQQIDNFKENYKHIIASTDTSIFFERNAGDSADRATAHSEYQEYLDRKANLPDLRTALNIITVNEKDIEYYSTKIRSFYHYADKLLTMPRPQTTSSNNTDDSNQLSASFASMNL